MARFELTEPADADIDEIATYTRRQWGAAQAQAYLTALRERFRQLARRPLTGRWREELAPGLRSFPFQSHVVYYERTDFGIRVMRVLHQRQEAARHLTTS